MTHTHTLTHAGVADQPERAKERREEKEGREGGKRSVGRKEGKPQRDWREV